MADHLFDASEYAAFQYGIHMVDNRKYKENLPPKLPPKPAHLAPLNNIDRPKCQPSGASSLDQTFHERVSYPGQESWGPPPKPVRKSLIVKQTQVDERTTVKPGRPLERLSLDQTFHERISYPGQDTAGQLQSGSDDVDDASKMLTYLWLHSSEDSPKRSGGMAKRGAPTDGDVIQGVNGRTFNRQPTIGDGDEEFVEWLRKREMKLQHHGQ